MIRLTKHAAEAMQERDIALAWVEAALTQPDWTTPDSRRAGLTRAFKMIPALDGRVMLVVFRRDGADAVVVTVHPERNARP